MLKTILIRTVLAAAVAFLPVPALSQVTQPQQQLSIRQIQPGLFVAGIPTDEFEYFAAPLSNGHQHQSNWCWAACIQMVLNYHGVAVTQEQVVQRIFNGQVPNLPGQPDQILAALSGWAFGVNGRPVMLQSTPFALNGSEIVSDLATKWPIIVGVQIQPGTGHAFVMTAVTYKIDQMN
ncbi:MAG: C39 family peptidase, partial [Acidobacteria bacterium]|nr:C39 family peptidase [Acidobacteriota bacterium]